MLRYLILTAFLTTIALLVQSCASEETDPDLTRVPNPKENSGGYVSNPDLIVSDSVQAKINEVLTELDKSGKAQVAVVLLKSIGKKIPKVYATELFNYWKIGDEANDNGLLILLIEDQRRIEFETGYGLEATLPDIICHKIQTRHMLPFFKSNDFAGGILEGINALKTYLEYGSLPENNGVPVTETVHQNLPDLYEIWWQDNVYTIRTNRKTSFLEAWRLVKNDYRFLNLPEIPDTSLSVIKETGQAYTYTIELPYEFTVGNAFEVIFHSVAFLVFYTIVTLILLSVSLTDHNRRLYSKNEMRAVAFYNRTFFNKPLIVFFLLITPIILLEVYLFVFKCIDAPGYISFGAGYCSWCIYAHLHFLILIPLKAVKIKDTHTRYEAYSEAYQNLKIYMLLFPLPLLSIYYYWQRWRATLIRNRVCLCECGTKMTKLNEVQDNGSITMAMISEEELLSVDYDVWICNSCGHHRIFRFENFKSSAMRCNSCGMKTVELVQTKVVVAATTHSRGRGYNCYHCRNCNESTKIEILIPKQTSDAGGHSNNLSSASDSSGWGGGSSGGGGAGSSW